MTFTRPLLLCALPLLAYFIWLGRPVGEYGRGRAWAALILRALLVLLVILSLAGLQTIHGSNELAVVFLLDSSDSVSPAQRQRGLDFIAQALEGMGPDDRAALVLFGADALVERPLSNDPRLAVVASVPRTYQTNIEEAVRLGLALFPSGAARRLVLLSDGRPTTGDAESAVRLARAQGAQVDVVPLGAPVEQEARLADLRLPTRLHQGETFTLEAIIETTVEQEATLTLLAGDRVAAREAVHLNPGRNRFALPLTAGQPGFIPYRVVLSPSTDTYPQNNSLSAYALVEGPPRVLLAAGEPAEAVSLAAALRAAGLTVVESSLAALPSDPVALAEYAAVVLVDTPARSLAPRTMSALQSFVRDLGGGLVAVGGPHAYGVGGWYDTPLEETLPVEMTLNDPRRFPPLSIVIIIDKSGSMSAVEGGVEKIRLAGEAAARVAELLNDQDEITVIAFDDRPADVIGPLPGSERETVIERVVRLQAGGGGIYVRESLQAALAALEGSTRTTRHILLLADGSDSEHQEGVPELVEREIAGQGITLSTVAIGAGQDLWFLEHIAELGGGRYHFTDRAANLPEIFAEETQLAMRSYIVEEPFYPRQTASSPLLAGIEAVPQLAGYVATTPKPAAQVILVTAQDDPLLAAWQYGLGRAVAWTSDATGRWAAQWVGWEGFARFWAQVVRWTIVQRADVPAELTVTTEGETARITLDAVDAQAGFVNGLDATVSLVGPEGETQTVALVQSAPGRYEETFTPQAEGVYLLRLTGSLDGREALAVTAGWVLGYSPEYAALTADPGYLSYLAGLGGGRTLSDPAAAFDHTLRGSGTARDLWPVLLGLAALLLPFDIGVRRLVLGRRDLARAGAWLGERLPRRRPVVVGERPVVMDRLFQAKGRVGQVRPPGPATSQPPTPSATPPAERPSPPPQAPSPAEGTLASQLLRRKRERGPE